QLVFAGNGWFVKSKNIDAYKGVDPAGRIAVIFGNPNTQARGVTRADYGKQGEEYMNPSDYARSKGVVGLIYVADSQYFSNWQRNRQRIERGSAVVVKFQTQTPATPLPSIVITPETANTLFDGETQTASVILNASSGSTAATPPAPFLLRDQKKITMNVASTTETVPTQNVVAVWEGSDPVLKAEYVA